MISASAGLTLGAGGNFVLAVQDANGSPGTGWDSLTAAGALTVAATNTAPFTIRLQSFANGQIDNVTNFNADTHYDWVIATAGSLSGFDPAKFAVDTSFFGNDLAGGYFYVHTNANSLVLSFTNNHPPAAATYTLFQSRTGQAVPIATLATNWTDPDGDPVVLIDVNDTSTNGIAATFDSHFIYYTNVSTVPDALFYSVQDVRTNPPASYRNGDTQRTAAGRIVFVPPPPISAFLIDGNNATFTGSNGIPDRSFYLLVSTNLALPLNQWQRVGTNAFDDNGNFSFTNAVDPAMSSQFYLLQLQ